MALHLVLSPGIDLDEFRRQSEQGQCPRHSMAVIADRYARSSIFRTRSGIAQRIRPNAVPAIRLPRNLGIAQRLADRLGPGEVVYCQSESVGLPMAALLGKGPSGPSSAFSRTISRAAGATSPPACSASPAGSTPWRSVARRRPNSSAVT